MMFDPSTEGRGIAYEAAKAAIAHAFDGLNWRTAVSYIHPENQRSIALAKKLGAILDHHAKVPDPANPCLVYRHLNPEVRLR